ncbi:MAG: alpha/beta fold hydrolase [Leptospiraceae bacterium]|nr:alpha/beta fold hydrolase [Leptospiraceae bacterium]MCP5494070.1 alpha/beta fold hydrolase [Leptospiraceae bacterium]
MKTSFVNASDVTLYLVSDKPKDKPDAETVLFLHGYPDNSKTWSYQMHSLGMEYQVAAYDIRGAGKSTQPINQYDFHIEKLQEDVLAVIDHLVGKEGKVHLVGHDWGAIIFWAFVSNRSYQKRVHSYTAVSGPHVTLTLKNMFEKFTSFNPMAIGEQFFQIFKSWYIMFFQVPKLPEFMWYTFPLFLWERILKEGGVPSNDEMYKYDKKEIFSCAVGTLNLYRELMMGGLPRLPEPPIEVPVSVIIPEDDLAILPSSYDKMEEIASNLKIHKLKANHWVHREKPREVNNIIRETIARARI